MFYRIAERGDGLVDIWLTPGQAVPDTENTAGRMEYKIRTLAVQGVDPDDPQWGGELEEHIREHYSWWIASADEVVIL